MIDRTQEVIAKVEDAKRAITKAWGEVSETEAKELTPVDTGRLRNSISFYNDAKQCVVGTAVEYAPSVEFNDRVSHNVGQSHYLRDGILRTSDERKEIAKNIFSNIK